MKTMRYRIRVIALVLICSLLILLLWIARSLCFPADPSAAPSPAPESPGQSVPSASPAGISFDSPWETPVLPSPVDSSSESPAESPAVSSGNPEMTVTPEPLYDIFGL